MTPKFSLLVRRELERDLSVKSTRGKSLFVVGCGDGTQWGPFMIKLLRTHSENLS